MRRENIPISANPVTDPGQIRRGADQAVRVVVEVADADVAGAADDPSDLPGGVVVVDHGLAVSAVSPLAAAAGARGGGQERDELFDVEAVGVGHAEVPLTQGAPVVPAVTPADGTTTFGVDPPQRRASKRPVEWWGLG